MAELALSLLGPFTAAYNNQPLNNFGTTKVQALLIYLAVEKIRPYRREHLFTLLWPGMPEHSARHNLRQVLYALRQVIPDTSNFRDGDPIPLLLADRQFVQLNPKADITVDLHQFESLITQSKKHAHPNLKKCVHCIQALEQAVSIYRGDFLADFYLEDSNAFEDWAEAVREKCRNKLLEALHNLTEIYISSQDYQKAQRHIKQQFEVDNLRESSHRQWMEVLALSGRRLEALRHYQEYIEKLESELGVTPSPQTTDLYDRIRDSGLTERSSKPPEAFKQPEQFHHNLTPQLTPFIGREEELAKLDSKLVDPAIRLITVTGPGGMGKTRLGIACAEQQVKSNTELFKDGVFFVPFAQITEADRIVSAIAEAINLKIEGSATVDQSPKQQLLETLRGKRMLLLLDNFEHLIVSENLLVDILNNAPGLKLLVTSRERLNFQAEYILMIEGLPTSDEVAPDEILESPAGRLFFQSAQRFQSDYEIRGDEDRTALALICNLVGGMPLALELAAGWVDALSLNEIAAEIERSLDFLKSDMRDIPERHRGIRAVFDPTWEQLGKGEKDVFMAFSIFRGGCNREAARVITGASYKTLASLSKKSLIQYRSKEGRYTVHELMRQYISEKLAKIPETEAAIQDAHCSYYCTMLEKWGSDLKSAQQSRVVAEIRADYQNILGAWDCAVERMNLGYLASAARGLSEYYEVTYGFAEAEKVFPRATQRIQEIYGPEPEITEAAWLLVHLLPKEVFTYGSYMGFCYVDENYERLLHHSLALLKTPALAQEDTRREEAFIRMQLGIFAQQDLDKHIGESYKLYKSLGDLMCIADLFLRTDWYPESLGELRNLFTENLTQIRQTGDPERITRSLLALGLLARSEGNYDEALQRHEEAYRVARMNKHPMGMVLARWLLIYLYWFLGEFDQAKNCQEEALELCQRTGNRYLVYYFLANTAVTHIYLGQFSKAIDLLEESTSYIQQNAKAFISIYVILAYAYLHAGKYDFARTAALKGRGIALRPWWPLTWLDLLEGRYSKVLAEMRQISTSLKDREFITWLQVRIGLALNGLGRTGEAKRELYQALQTCVEMRSFLPLMHLMPILPVVLAASENDRIKERAVELYALAKTVPFVANSRLFEEVAEHKLKASTAHLPKDVMRTAQRRGQTLDLWETAAELLKELRKLDWTDPLE
jgi:DNA-binding SARP family transcriptional activator/predicted ATPase